MMQGFPISAKLPEDLGFGERFWYWRGVSGRSYIHSIYPAECCPPLPGAVFVGVRKLGGTRHPLSVGRFPNCFEGSPFAMSAHGSAIAGGDEIHVHLLARDNEGAERVLRDLSDALAAESAVAAQPAGFSEPVQPLLIDA